MKTIVFDLEIQKAIVPSPEKCTEADRALVAAGKAVHGWDNAHKGGISSAVAYCLEEDRYHVFGDRRDEHLRLVDLLQNADRVVGFNHWNFDYPLLAASTGVVMEEITDMAAAPGERDIDLLQMIWAGLGGRYFAKGNGLDAVTLATLGERAGGKNGNGAEAPLLYQQGMYGPLLNYNVRDVDLTRRLLRFINEHGYCINGEGKVIKPVHPREWFTR
ncbi:MAG: hypothetical protein PHE83_18670 [Opitutaceae bacterium]|nr:hypothetical protein [Opitutaceae bacterium]